MTLKDLNDIITYPLYINDFGMIQCNKSGCPCMGDASLMTFPGSRRGNVYELLEVIRAHKLRYENAEHGCGIPGCVNAANPHHAIGSKAR